MSMSKFEKAQFAAEKNGHVATINDKLESNWPYKEDMAVKRKAINRYVVRDSRTRKIVAIEKHRDRAVNIAMRDSKNMYDIDEDVDTTYFVNSRKTGLTVGEFKCPKKAMEFARMIKGTIKTYAPTDEDRDDELREKRAEKNLHRQFAEENKGQRKRYLRRPKKA